MAVTAPNPTEPFPAVTRNRHNPHPPTPIVPQHHPLTASRTRLLDVCRLCLSLSDLDEDDERPGQHNRQHRLLGCAVFTAQFVTLPSCHSANSMQLDRVAVSMQVLLYQ